jgi:hypothetical protein
MRRGVVIKILWFGGHVRVPSSAEGKYVKAFDPDAHDGLGDVVLCTHAEDAKKFQSFADAVTFYHQVSRVRPSRDDGKPNRPLTAYTVSMEGLPLCALTSQ